DYRLCLGIRISRSCGGGVEYGFKSNACEHQGLPSPGRHRTCTQRGTVPMVSGEQSKSISADDADDDGALQRTPRSISPVGVVLRLFGYSPGVREYTSLISQHASGVRRMSKLRTAERCQELSQGYAFFAYPWRKYAINKRTPAGVRGILDTPSRCGSLASDIAQHASGVC